MSRGEHRWIIDEKQLNTMVQAKNKSKFISPKFKMSHLIWQLECYPNGNSPQSVGSFNLYLRLMSMPLAWKDITICRTFKCKETQSGYTAVSKYQKDTSLGWPDFTLTMSDINSRIHWLKQLKFIINIKILQIRLNKNDGQIFYENKINPFKSLSKQTIKWKINDDLLHEMKQSYFKKGFVSPIYNDIWCYRIYPNGKSIKGDFLVQLQLCGLPKQTNKLNVNWKINCAQVNLSAGWTTEFDYKQSCWGWGNNQLSFEKFKKCQTFEIETHIYIDEQNNIIAMREWEKYVNNKFISSIINRKKCVNYNNYNPEEKSDILYDSQNKKQIKKSNKTQLRGELGKLAIWIENRLEIQDEILDALRNEVLEIKNEIANLLIESEDKQNKYLKNEILRIEKHVNKLINGNYKININNNNKNNNILSEQEKVEKWFNEIIKLPQYSKIFIEQGFDSLDSIIDITKDDLIGMGIEKIGHQRKIIKNASQI
eukprot:443362_1